MARMIKARAPLLTLILFVFAVGYSVANVVVIPLDSSEKARWALVEEDGTILNQSGGITVLKPRADAWYYMNFGEDITGRAIVATPRYSGSIYPTLVVSACGGDLALGGLNCRYSNNVNTVAVGSRDIDGNYLNNPFYVAVLP